jgi:hypothetical protein
VPHSSPQAAVANQTYPVITAELFKKVSSDPYPTLLAGPPSNLTCHITAPAKLDTSLMKEPRMIHGAPRVSKTANTARRKPLPKLMNGLAISPPS